MSVVSLMNLTPLQYVAIALNLCRQVVRRWQIKGRLTIQEKYNVLILIEILTSQLFRCISDLRGEFVETFRELEVPGVQHSCLEYKCTDTDNKSDPGDPLSEPCISM